MAIDFGTGHFLDEEFCVKQKKTIKKHLNEPRSKLLANNLLFIALRFQTWNGTGKNRRKTTRFLCRIEME